MTSDRIPWETEPFVSFHPILVGTCAPGTVQPVDRPLLLEEEPATWPSVVGSDRLSRTPET